MQRHPQRAADVELLGPRRGLLRLADDAGGHHALQHGVLALGGAGQVGDRVGIAGVLRQASQHRRLGDRQRGQRLAEVGVGRGGKAVGPLAEVDLVHVELQDLVLAQLALDLQRQQGLFELALGRAPRRQKEGARHLLGDGGRPLAHAAGGCGHQRPQHAFGVDAAVLAKARVLHRQQGLLHQQRDLGDRHKLPPLAAELGDLDAVCGVDLQGLARLVVGDAVQRRQLRGVPGHRRQQCDQGHQQRAQPGLGQRAPAPPRREAPGRGIGKRGRRLERHEQAMGAGRVNCPAAP